MVLGLNFARRHPLLTGFALAGVAAGYLTESRLDPAEWNPDPIPEMSGPLAPNHELTGAPRVLTGEGPEDVTFDAEGRLYTGLEDGRVVRTVDPVDGDTVEAETETVATVTGRPHALAFDGDGADADLYVPAIGTGLHRIDVAAGTAELVADTAGGRDIVFADDLEIVDGTVYFSDASVHELFQDELLELGDTGRLLAYDTETGDCAVLLEDLGFANGVALGPDGESLLVNETSRYRVRRYWFAGEREGEDGMFAENLVGFPDNVDRGEDCYWVAIPSTRDPALERLHGSAWLKRQIGKLPEAVAELLSGDPYGLVLQLDEDGTVVDSLHDPTGGVHGVTSATPHEGALYVGTLFGDSVVRYDLD